MKVHYLKPKQAGAEPPKFLVAIGASVIGLNALIEMVATLEKGLNTAYCIVLHLSKKAIGELVKNRLALVASMPCSLIQNKGELNRDNIYIARAKHHLIVADGFLVSGGGPKTAGFRPSIDVFFSSVAQAYGQNAIGIVLSGPDTDSAEGMCSIKNAEGICIVQNPKNAAHPEMPLSVINTLQVDYIVPLKAIGSTITEIINRKQAHKERLGLTAN